MSSLQVMASLLVYIYDVVFGTYAYIAKAAKGTLEWEEARILECNTTKQYM